MLLIIAEQSDLAAHWLHAALAGRLAIPVHRITPAQLVYAPSIQHHLTSDESQSRFHLWSGEELDFTKINGIINRITALPLAHLESAAPADRDYAAGELHAFLLGWLASLDCPLLNPPSPTWLAGEHHAEMCATHFAVQAGLSCPPLRIGLTDAMPPPPIGEREVHFVLDGQVIGPLLNRRSCDALISFANAWGARLVQIETRAEGSGRVFLRATSFPEYQLGGAALVRAIAKVFGA